MTFGLLLKGANEIYFNRTIQFVFEFIPQLFFMIGLFGYMITPKHHNNKKDVFSEALKS